MINSQHQRSLLLGLVLAPAGAVLGLHIGALKDPLTLVGIDWKVAAFSYAIALPGIVIFFMPAVILLRNRGQLSWRSILVAGFLAGNLYYQLLAVFLSDGFYLGQIIEGSLAGLFAGIGFSLGVWPHHSSKPTSARDAA